MKCELSAIRREKPDESRKGMPVSTARALPPFHVQRVNVTEQIK